MKRVLTLTTAISVALAGMPPVPLWAQDQGAAQAQCPADQPDCEPAKKPRKPRKPAAQQEGQQGQEPQQQGQQQGKPAKPAKPAAADEPQQGQAGKPAKPARQKPAASEPSAEPPAEPAAEPVPQQRPAKRQSAKPQAGAEQSGAEEQAKPQRQPKPTAEPEAEPTPLPAQDEPADPPVTEQQQAKPQRQPKPAPEPEAEPAPLPAQDEPAEPPVTEQQQAKPQRQPKPAAEPEPQQQQAEQPEAQPTPKPRKPAKPDAAEQEQARPPRQQQAEQTPAPDADTAINDVLAADQQARPAKRQGQQAAQPPEEVAPQRRPQAAIAAERAAEQPVQQQTRRQVKRQRIGEADLRRADEEFRNPLRADQQEQAEDDDDDGLSDLEKAGLVVLGALAVGALLKNGNRVVSNSGDRVVVDQGNGQYFVMKDDDTLLRQPGNEVETETFADGSIRTTVYRPDGSRVVTVRDAAGRVLQRVGIDRYGNQTLLIDDLNYQPRPVNFDSLPRPVPEDLRISTRAADAELRAAMLARQAARVGESFSLQQIRDYPQVRGLAPTIDVQNVTFDTGSAAIRASEAQNLSDLGEFMAQMIKDNPAEMFLIEGHTDAVGDAAYNLALSDRRAESLALALTEYFDVPPENMVVQGYGESELIVAASGAEPANRRTTVRMISPLMQQLAQAN